MIYIYLVLYFFSSIVTYFSIKYTAALVSKKNNDRLDWNKKDKKVAILFSLAIPHLMILYIICFYISYFITGDINKFQDYVDELMS